MFDLWIEGNPSQEHIDEYVALKSGFVARKYSIIGTSFVKYAVYKPSPCMSKEFISFHRSEEFGILADVSTYRYSSELFPYGSPERCQAVDRWYLALACICENAVREAFPQDFENVQRKYEWKEV